MKLLLLISIFACWVCPSIGANRFVCYFPNWSTYRTGAGQFSVSNINPNLCTHYMYAFAILDGSTYNIVTVDSWADISLKGYANFVAMKSKNPNMKTMISLGGWTDSTDGTRKYSRLVSNSANIAAFVKNALNFLATYKFDGLDIDWEFPSSAADKAGYSALLTALRTAFNPYGYILSAAVASGSATIDNGYDVPTLSKTLDFINLMTYDMHGASWESSVADHHAPLYKRSWETTNNNVDYSVNYWLSKGFPAAKINLGIPLYGQSWTIKSTASVVPPAPANGLGAPGPILAQSGYLGYNEICLNVKSNGWKVVQDTLGQRGPIAYSPASLSWVGYDDPNFAAVKSNYILAKRLGGAIVWDISTDDFSNACGAGANPIQTAISKTILGGQTTSAPQTTAVPTTTSKIVTTTTAKVVTTTAKVVTTTPSTAKPTTQSGKFVCPSSNGLFPDPISCSNFYSCANGMAYRMSCGTGLLYNPTISVCDWPANVKCNIG